MWPLPEPGDIVWCHFPTRPRDLPGPKPRPALGMAVAEHEDGVLVTVAYGTSQKLDQLMAGEFAIRKAESLIAFKLSGLSFDTKFNLRRQVDLPWGSEFFGTTPCQNLSPRLGCLHPSLLLKAVKSAIGAIA